MKVSVIDVETTGFGSTDRLVEIAIVSIDSTTGRIVDEYDTLLNPERDVGPTGVHGIAASHVALAPTFREVSGAIARRVDSAILVGHNLSFDSRLLRQEFDRMSCDVRMGTGFCTLARTRQKLTHACVDRGIDHTQQHRALSDARATAELAMQVGLLESLTARDIRPATCFGQSQLSSSERTLRRDVSMNDSIMRRVVARTPLPEIADNAQAYLYLLDWVLDDGVIDSSEHSKLNALASQMMLTRKEQRDAHRDYLRSMIGAAERDGVVMQAERETLIRFAEQMDVTDVRIPDAETPLTESLRPGMRVCFTGEARLSRSVLHRLARHAGYAPVSNLTKSRCDALIAADPSSMSGKTRNARKWGKPILSVEQFLSELEQ